VVNEREGPVPPPPPCLPETRGSHQSGRQLSWPMCHMLAHGGLPTVAPGRKEEWTTTRTSDQPDNSGQACIASLACASRRICRARLENHVTKNSRACGPQPRTQTERGTSPSWSLATSGRSRPHSRYLATRGCEGGGQRGQDQEGGRGADSAAQEQPGTHKKQSTGESRRQTRLFRSEVRPA